jgi:hypothetical protein
VVVIGVRCVRGLVRRSAWCAPGRVTVLNWPICFFLIFSASDLKSNRLAGLRAFIWSDLCTRHIPNKLMPRGHEDWPDKRPNRESGGCQLRAGGPALVQGEGPTHFSNQASGPDTDLWLGSRLYKGKTPTRRDSRGRLKAGGRITPEGADRHRIELGSRKYNHAIGRDHYICRSHETMEWRA